MPTNSNDIQRANSRNLQNVVHGFTDYLRRCRISYFSSRLGFLHSCSSFLSLFLHVIAILRLYEIIQVKHSMMLRLHKIPFQFPHTMHKHADPYIGSTPASLTSHGRKGVKRTQIVANSIT